MLDGVLKWIENNSSTIQAVSSILLFIITVIYVKATFKMVHVSHKCYVKPLKICTSGKSEITLRNYGMGIALNVRAFVTSYRKISDGLILNRNGGDSVDLLYLTLDDYFIEGKSDDSDIIPGKCIKFIFDNEICLKIVKVCWETITGEKQTTYYKPYRIENGNIMFKRYNSYRIIRTIKSIFLKPIYLFVKFLLGSSLEHHDSLDEILDKNTNKK